jgi:hypothetical protein
MFVTKLFIYLLFFFLLLSMYNHFRNKSNAVKRVIEGYTDPGLANDPIFLATTNAANIAHLKEQIDGILALKQQVTDLGVRVTNNETGINSLTSQFTNGGQQLIGRDPSSTDPLPVPTGLD